MKIDITRTSFCQRCKDAQRPKHDDVFAVKGSNGWHIKNVDIIPRGLPYGFTPHVFTLQKSEKGFVVGYKVCCMQDCGMDIRHNPKFNKGNSEAKYLIYHNLRVPFKMSIADWNALILNKDFGYRIDEE